MANKTFTEKQREIIARKLGYDGPMSQFDKFVRSSPAMEQKVKQLAVKLVARGGFIKKFAKGGTPVGFFPGATPEIYRSMGNEALAQKLEVALAAQAAPAPAPAPAPAAPAKSSSAAPAAPAPAATSPSSSASFAASPTVYASGPPPETKPVAMPTSTANITVDQLFQSILGRTPNSTDKAFYEQKYGSVIDPSEVADFVSGMGPGESVTKEQASQKAADITKQISGVAQTSGVSAAAPAAQTTQATQAPTPKPKASIYVPGSSAAAKAAADGASHKVGGVQIIPGAPGYDETKALATLKQYMAEQDPSVVEYLKSINEYDKATEQRVNARKESEALRQTLLNAVNTGKVTQDQIKDIENQLNAGANEGVVYKNALAKANVQTTATTNIDARKTEMEGLVKSTFGTVLKRQPLQGGLDYWTNRLLNNEISPQDLAMYIAGGATGDDKAVADAWLAGQTGAADPTTGLTTGAETTEDEIAKKRSVAEAIVNSVFRTVLKRDPLEGGLNYWVERLMSGEIKPSELGQYVAEGATGDDKVAADRWLKSLNPETNELTYSPMEIPGAPTVPIAPTMDVATIGTPAEGQLIGAQTPVTATTAAPAVTAEAAQATAPTAAAAPTIDAVKSKGAVDTAIAGNQAITGTLSSSAQATAAETKPAETAVKDLEAAKLANPREVIGVPERTLQAGELVSGPSVNMSTVDAALNKAEAATAAVKPEMTIQGQLDKLLADFDSGNPPSWAASSLRNANAVMAARGMGASSLAGQAIVQATLEAAVPIAAQDAQTVAALEMQNLSNRQQVAVLVAQQRAAFLGQEFDQEFQTRVTNAARVADIANLNFTAEQTIALENARLAQTVDLANLSNDQALVMARAAQVANLESANLNNRQQAALQNAQAFLQLDLTNLNNEQQTALFNSEKTIQSILTDTAAENAAKQFNAASEMQVQQFYDSLVAQVSQFNTSQTNALRQFNVSQENALSMFNAEQDNAVSKFNAQNRLIIDQSNAEWRRNIATVDTAAQNTANQFDAQAGLQITMAEYNNQWQNYRDIIEYAFTSTENAANRNNTLAIAVLQKEAAIEAAKAEVQGKLYEALGGLGAKVYEGAGGLAGTVKALTDAGKGIAEIFGNTSTFDPNDYDINLDDYRTFLETDEDSLAGYDYWGGSD